MESTKQTVFLVRVAGDIEPDLKSPFTGATRALNKCINTLGIHTTLAIATSHLRGTSKRPRQRTKSVQHGEKESTETVPDGFSASAYMAIADISRKLLENSLDSLSLSTGAPSIIWEFSIARSWATNVIYEATETQLFFFRPDLIAHDRLKFEMAIGALYFEPFETIGCPSDQMPPNAMNGYTGGWSNSVINYNGKQVLAYLLFTAWRSHERAALFKDAERAREQLVKLRDPHMRRFWALLGWHVWDDPTLSEEYLEDPEAWYVEVREGDEFIDPLKRLAEVGYERLDVSWDAVRGRLPERRYQVGCSTM